MSTRLVLFIGLLENPFQNILMLLELLVSLNVAWMVAVLAVGKSTFTLSSKLITRGRPFTRNIHGDTRQEYGLAHVRGPLLVLFEFLLVFLTACIPITTLKFVFTLISNKLFPSVLWLA